MPAGRKTKYTPEVVKAITDALTLGVPYRYACAVAGIDQKTFERWRDQKVEFAEAIKKAEAVGIGARLDRIRQAEKAGTWQASAWWLERRYPQDFGKTVTEQQHTGKDGAPLRIVFERVDKP